MFEPRLGRIGHRGLAILISSLRYREGAGPVNVAKTPH